MRAGTANAILAAGVVLPALAWAMLMAGAALPEALTLAVVALSALSGLAALAVATVSARAFLRDYRAGWALRLVLALVLCAFWVRQAAVWGPVLGYG